MAIDQFAALGSAVNKLVCEFRSAALRKGCSGLDVDKAVSYIEEHAAAGSTGLCAKFVRLALKAGGVAIDPWPDEARKYGPYLLRSRFIALSIAPSGVAAGDVCVIQPYKGGNPAGHIQMFTGAKWYSDFEQREFWPGAGFRTNKPAYALFRP